MCFNGTIFLFSLRFEIDLSRLPLNERQLYTHVLDPGKGRLVFLVTLRPCWGVSISDIETAALENPDERDTVVDRFVSYFLLWIIFLSKKRVHTYWYNILLPFRV